MAPIPVEVKHPNQGYIRDSFETGCKSQHLLDVSVFFFLIAPEPRQSEYSRTAESSTSENGSEYKLFQGY